MLVWRGRGDGAGNPDELADLEIAVRGQRHHRNRADLLHAQIEIGELHAVGELHDQAVERREASSRRFSANRVARGLICS